MKLTKNGVYKASNVTFDPNAMTATSYDWWRFVQKVDDKIIFNDYRYSNTTSKHQHKVLRLLHWKRDDMIFLAVPKGLQDPTRRESAIAYYQSQINDLREMIERPRSRKDKNLERIREIQRLEYKIEQVKGFL